MYQGEDQQLRCTVITLCTSEAAAQCIVIGHVCLCVGVFVGLLPRQLEMVCIDPHQTGSVGKGSDHLQVIKFWPSRTPREGGLRAGRNFWLRLTTASVQCLSLLRVLFSFYHANLGSITACTHKSLVASERAISLNCSCATEVPLHTSAHLGLH